MLAIRRHDGRFLGAPTKDTRIKEKDVLAIYGRKEILEELDERRAGREGDRVHQKAVSKQREVLEKQEEEEKDKDREGG